MVRIRILRIEEGICIWIDRNTLELTTDHSGNHLPEMIVLICKLNIGPYLGTGITEPHSVDIACVYESIFLSILIVTVINSGVKSVREAVGEHPAEFRIGQECCNFLNFLFYGFGCEVPVFYSRTTVNCMVIPCLAHGFGIYL